MMIASSGTSIAATNTPVATGRSLQRSRARAKPVRVARTMFPPMTRAATMKEFSTKVRTGIRAITSAKLPSVGSEGISCGGRW